MTQASTDVTLLFHRIDGGDEAARADLWSLVYGELRRLASGQMSAERVQHTLQPTALVHEAWLRLVGQQGSGFDGRGHFFSVAAEAMRRILVEHARRRNAQRRGGGRPRMDVGTSTLDRLGASRPELIDGDVEALDAALDRLEATGRHERKCQVVKLRFFAGMSIDEVAEVLDISPATVKRDWEFAKAWLGRELNGREADS